MPYLTHLQDRQHYEDRYDEITVELCRITEGVLTEKYPKAEPIYIFDTRSSTTSSEEADKYNTWYAKLTKEQKEYLEMRKAIWLHLYFQMWDRYQKREKTINDWIARDREWDEKRKNIWDSAEPRKDKRCRKCGEMMKDDMKEMMHQWDVEDAVIFVYECPDCKYREWEYVNWEVYKLGPPMTEEELVAFKKELEESRKPPTKKELEKKKQEANLLERDKLRFCMTSEQGREYVEFTRRMKEFEPMLKRFKEREEGKKSEPEKLIEQITFLEAQKRIKKVITWKKFLKLKFWDPDIARDVTCEFTTYEWDPDRDEKKALKQLQKLFDKALEWTSWRLMKTLESKMGIYKGKIRGEEKSNVKL